MKLENFTRKKSPHLEMKTKINKLEAQLITTKHQASDLTKFAMTYPACDSVTKARLANIINLLFDAQSQLTEVKKELRCQS